MSALASRFAPLRLILRLVAREVPHSLGQFSILIACIAIGVGAIVAVTSLSRALDAGLAGEGRVILGADAAFTLVQREASAAELDAIARHGKVSRIVLSRGMAISEAGESTLVEIKAIDAAYPVAGSFRIEGDAEVVAAPVERLAPGADGIHGIAIDATLAGKMDLKTGSALRIGGAQLRVTGLIANEPDKLAGGLGFGPRVIVSQAGLAATGLVQPGSLTRFVYRLDLGTAADASALQASLAAIQKAAPDAGWQVATRLRASPQLQRQVGRFTQFLTLVGLTALLVGGVGVANAARAFAEKQVMRIAMLKSLGATQRFVFVSALAQVMAFALIGIAIGLTVGVALPYLAIRLLGDLLPFPLQPGVYPGELAGGLAYGFVTALTFAILPLARGKAVPASTLFRDAFGEARFRPTLADLALIGIALAAFVLLVVGLANDRMIAMIYLAAAAFAIVTLRLVAWGVMRFARALPHPRNPVLRLALANLHRPGSLTPSVILSLGLGLTLLVALALIDINLSRQFRAALPGVAPTFFFVDIPAREMPRFEAFLKTEAPGAGIEQVPQLRGRILELNGTPASQIKAAERVSWVLDGDRGITYAAKPPEGSTIAAGEWWPDNYRGPPLVSFAKDVADGLGLKPGDSLVVNVLGRRIEAKIANLREVRWQRLGINFVMVFSPNTFAGAPYTALATLTLPKETRPEEEAVLARKVGIAFPAISSVRVRDTLLAVDKIVSQLALAIRASSAIALLASILVLGGALAAAARTRQHESVILKTLGATRWTLMQAQLVEYAALGGIAIVFGLICGATGAGFVVTKIMTLDFTIPWPTVVSTAISAFLVTIILGMAGTWHLLGQKPAPYLRHA